MQLVERDTDILAFLAKVGFATAAQVRQLFFPKDKDGSATRTRLAKLLSAGIITKRRAEVVNPLQTNSTPVWLITESGLSMLAATTNKPEYLELHPPSTASWQNFAHYATVTDFWIMMRSAFAAQNYVKLHQMYFEHTVVNPHAAVPKDRFKLYTEIAASPKRIVCAPDAAFEIQVKDHRRAYYLELERGFDTPARVIAKKGQGFVGLAETLGWKKHFPLAQDFRVLALTPSPGWRDALRRHVREYGKGADLWMFATSTEVTAQNFLHGNVMYTVGEGSRPLVRPEALPPVPPHQ